MKNSVEAIILAGGKGTRLAPLTEDTPKPMLKIMGKTVLENVFDRLDSCGIKKANVTTMYLPWQIESLGSKHGNLLVNYIREQASLGTAGAVKNAYDGESDTVIVLSGDGVYDFDLKAAIDFHFEKNADVTIVTYLTENPLEYGVVLYDSQGKVSRFAEKPPWAQVISGTVNTGIYIINRDIIDKIPPNTEYDFAKQLFPLLLAGKSSIYAYESGGIWHDIGNLDSYFAANCSALDGKLPDIKNTGFTEKELADKNVEVEMPVYVSRKAVIGENVKLGAYTVISDDAVISDGCDIACSVIGDGAVLGMGCGIYGTLIGRNTKLGENCVTSEGCAIGANCEADDSVIFPKYAFIHSGSHISGTDHISGRSGGKDRTLFEENGIKYDINKINPEYVLKLGYATALAVSSKKTPGSTRIGVMCDNNRHSKYIGDLILNGICSAGVRSMSFSGGYEAMARFAALEFVTDAVIYVCRTNDGDVNIKIFDGFGLPVCVAFERELTGIFYSFTEYNAPDRFYSTDSFTDIDNLYYSELLKYCRELLGENTLDGFSCSFAKEHDIRSDTPAYTAICALSELGGNVERKKTDTVCCFDIDATGLDASCVYGGKKIDMDHIRALLLKGIQKLTPSQDKEPLLFHSSAPSALKKVAEKCGFAVKEYAESSPRNTKLFTKKQMQAQLVLSDAVFATLALAIVLHSQKTDIASLAKQLPDFEVYTKSFEGNPNRASVMQRLTKLSVKEKDNTLPSSDREGIRLVLSNGSITVIPGKISGFKIISEAKSTEAAKELCDKAEDFLK